MNTQHDLEQVLRAHFDARAERTVSDGQLAAIFDRTAGRGQRPAWLAALRSPTMSATTLTARPAIPRTAWLLVAVGLLAAVVAGAVYIGNQNAQPDKPLNGLIVFGRMNDALGDTVAYTIRPDGTGLTQVRPGTVEGPFWSPDGTKLGLGFAYANADGSNYHAFDKAGISINIHCWDWSPDGQRLLCEGWSDSEDEQVHGIYTVRASDGGDLQRVDQPGDQGVPGAYSPDGTTIAYNGTFEGAEESLILVNVDGSNRRKLGFSAFQAPSWAPDSTSLLVARAGLLYSIDAATGIATTIRIQGDPGAVLLGGQWSPDGSRILFKRFMGDENDPNTDLFTMLPDGTDVVQVTNSPEEDRFFDWGTHPLE